MSEGYQLRHEGSYHSYRTSYESVRPEEAERRQLADKIELIQQQLTQQSELREELVEVARKHEESNYHLLKGQISETQLALSRLLEKTLSRIEPASFVDANAEQPRQKSAYAAERAPAARGRAPLLKYVHVDEQLQALYDRTRRSVYEDPEFEICSEATGVRDTLKWHIDEAPNADTASLFPRDGALDSVESAGPATKVLSEVLNMLAGTDPALITRLFEPAEEPLPARPMFCVWLNTGGQFNPYFLDSALPFHAQTLEPLFCRASKGQQVWPMLLEKAVAKACGGYPQLASKGYADLISMLTGMPTRQVAPDGSERLWRSITGSVDNGSFLFAFGQSGEFALVDGYKSNEQALVLKVSNKKAAVPFGEFCGRFLRLYTTNLHPNYHFNYCPLTLSGRRTLSADLELTCRSHIVLIVESREPGLPSPRDINLCVYRAEEDVLQLVAESTAARGLSVEAMLRKGAYKVFISLEPLRLAEADCEDKPGGALRTDRSQFQTERNAEELSVMLTVASRENFRCGAEIETLRKEGSSRIGNSDISYQALRGLQGLQGLRGLQGQARQPKKLPRDKSRHLKRPSPGPSTDALPRREVKFLTKTALG